MSLVRRLISVGALVGFTCAATGGQPAFAAACVPGTFYVSQRLDSGVARVTVDDACTMSVQNNWVNTPPMGPDSVVFAPNGNLLISNTDQGMISEIDPNTGAVVRSPVNMTPLGLVGDLAIQPGTNLVYAIGLGGNYIARVDLATGQTTIRTARIGNLYGITFNGDGTRLFVSSHYGSIAEIDFLTGNVVRVVTPGGSPDGMTFDPHTGNVYVSGCPFGICQVSIDSGGMPMLRVDTQLTAANGDGIAADGNGHLLVASNFNDLYSLDIQSNTAIRIATDINSADDVAPIVGAGAPLPIATPELDSLALFGSGILGVAAYLKMRRRAGAAH